MTATKSWWLLACALAACAPRAAPNSASVRDPVTLEEAEMTNAKHGYLLLDDCSIHPDHDGPPKGLYVRGQLADGRFIPEGGVEGQGELTGAGTPGWLELRNVKFYPAMTARAPAPPICH